MPSLTADVTTEVFNFSETPKLLLPESNLRSITTRMPQLIHSKFVDVLLNKDLLGGMETICPSLIIRAGLKYELQLLQPAT